MSARQQLSLGRYAERVDLRLRAWQREGFLGRLAAKDPSLWSLDDDAEVGDRLGWLELPESMVGAVDALEALGRKARRDGVEHVVLSGMGGSSLAPQVFQQTLGQGPGSPELSVLDSTHPEAVHSLARVAPAERTLFVISSKSGTTVETLSFFYWWWSWVRRTGSNPGNRFLAVTDKGTPLEALARERGFRGVFRARPDVGGRYSALGHFGLVPAALIGVDVGKLLRRGRAMMRTVAADQDARQSPPLELGAALGELALAGRNKVTFLATPGLAALPDWLEQLLAESTGKDGRGILPVAHEPLRSPDGYGGDRCFVGLLLEGEEDEGPDEELAALEAAGHPVIRLTLADPYDLGAEMVRWEVATAVAGAILGIHPFNQPDVELAKRLAREAMAGGEPGAAGELVEVGGGDREALRAALDDLLAAAEPGGYVAIQAFLAPSAAVERGLEAVQRRLGERTGLATTRGYGPRFLHSTGQFHKGGPPGGRFLQLFDEPLEDLDVPEAGYTFGRLIRAQALGDARALLERGRSLLRVRLGTDPCAGLETLAEVIGPRGSEA